MNKANQIYAQIPTSLLANYRKYEFYQCFVFTDSLSGMGMERRLRYILHPVVRSDNFPMIHKLGMNQVNLGAFNESNQIYIAHAHTSGNSMGLKGHLLPAVNIDWPSHITQSSFDEGKDLKEPVYFVEPIG